MELLKNYNPTSEEEKHCKDKMLQLYEAKGEKAFKRNSLEAHFTASALIINTSTKELLLLHHKKLNKWLQPGGHADGETNLEKVARKEVYEETGLNNLKLASNGVYDIDIHHIPESKGIPEHYHYDVRFAYFCNRKEKTKINSESNDFQWIKINEVNRITSEPSILRLVQKTKTIIHGI
jgi:8-oxo-dGTP pyrophosphatase MutT (NUDIX family)